MAKRERLNEYFNGQGFLTLCATALIAVAALALLLGVEPDFTQANGVFFTHPRELISNRFLSCVINVLCLLTCGWMMQAINKLFTFARSMTHLLVSAFYLLELANPARLVSFNSGTLMCAVTLVMLLPLFASYQDSHAQRSIFSTFAVITTGCLFHYGYAILAPVFLLGFLNMGAFNIKGFIAMLLGIATPLWIVLGLGLATPTQFTPPHFSGIWRQAANNASPLLAATTATVTIGITLAAINLRAIMNYRLQTRVYNTFLITALALMVAALCYDYSHVAIYLPLVNVLVAIQVGLVHSLRSASRRYLFIVLITGACFASCFVNLFL